VSSSRYPVGRARGGKRPSSRGGGAAGSEETGTDGGFAIAVWLAGGFPAPQETRERATVMRAARGRMGSLLVALRRYVNRAPTDNAAALEISEDASPSDLQNIGNLSGRKSRQRLELEATHGGPLTCWRGRHERRTPLLQGKLGGTRGGVAQKPFWRTRERPILLSTSSASGQLSNEPSTRPEDTQDEQCRADDAHDPFDTPSLDARTSGV
jgi:hypothetical protein